MITRTGHRNGSPLRTNPMTSLRTPFFWSVNVSVAKHACCSCSMGAEMSERRVSLMNSWTSLRRKGVLLLSVYSPGQMRKKKAIMIMSAEAATISVAEGDCTTTARRQRTCMGIGLTRRGAGSDDFQALIVHWRRKSMTWAEFKQGSLAPICKNICATNCR
jgi:hypothetical protein